MANLITVGRVAMLFGAVGMIYSRNYMLVVLAGILIAIVFAGDGIDGWVARRRGSSSRLGAVLDIAGDRVVENVLWVVFAHLHVIPVWAPLIVLSRSFTVDVMRSVALEQGKTAFGNETMARSRITHFLTASRFSRAYYGWSKGFAFFFLTLLFAWRLPGADGRFLDALYDLQAFRALVWFLVYSSVAICVIRGLPVIYDALYYLRDDPGTDEPAARERPVSTLAAERGERGTSA
ncbi:MAG: CDP-alcohol phosphatidyltransferase family protein [Chloroflexia bacterium]|jgi:CDP-diacylglycerol--glycerol-3-phosphate 3-phosphatidyltransferase|nr:CDP-alcohol phosphatidyltransferase family protein [Chloroflexia bacterium]